MSYGGNPNFVSDPYQTSLGIATTSYANPQWYDTSLLAQPTPATAYPVLTTVGTQLTAYVHMIIAAPYNSIVPGVMEVRGLTNQGFEFDATGLGVQYFGGIPDIYASTIASKAFTKVDMLDLLTVDWQYSLDGGNNWASAGTSRNRVYVALAAPNNLTVPLYESLAYIGCNAAQGDTASYPLGNNVIMDVMSKFESRKK